MSNLTNAEQNIVDFAIHYQSNNPVQAKAAGKTKREREEWYKLAYKHLTESLLPKIRANDEMLIRYWVTFFTWGEGAAHKRAIYDDRTYLYRTGTFGTGYTCLTLSNLYIVSLNGQRNGFLYMILDCLMAY